MRASSATKLRLQQKGVASSDGRRGDQYVTLKIVAPKPLSPKGAELLRQLQATEGFDPRKDVPWK